MVRTSERHMTTRSTAGSWGKCWRKLSRISRRIRLRSWARRRAFLAMAMPKRGNPSELAAARAFSPLACRRLPCWKTRWNSTPRVRRTQRGNPPAASLPASKILRDQASTAFGTTGTQDFTPISSGHTGAKTVGTGTMQIARLEGSFHDKSPINSENRSLVAPKKSFAIAGSQKGEAG